MIFNTKTTTSLLILLLFFVVITQSCITSKPHNSVASKSSKTNKSVVQLNDEASKLIKKQKYDSALGVLNQAAKKDKSYYLTYLNMTHVYVKKKQFNKAIVSSKKILKLKPRFAEMWTFTGMLYEYSGSTSTAKKYYKKSTDLFYQRIKNPVNKDQIVADKYNRAFALILLGKEKEGRAELKKLASEHPDDSLIKKTTNLKRKDYMKKTLGI